MFAALPFSHFSSRSPSLSPSRAHPPARALPLPLRGAELPPGSPLCSAPLPLGSLSLSLSVYPFLSRSAAAPFSGSNIDPDISSWFFFLPSYRSSFPGVRSSLFTVCSTRRSYISPRSSRIKYYLLFASRALWHGGRQRRRGDEHDFFFPLPHRIFANVKLLILFSAR